MNFINNLMAKAKATTTKAAETLDTAAKSIISEKIIWVPLTKLVIDPDVKGIFEQKENEINNICDDMKVNGFNSANPLTVSQDYVVAEGHTRYLASQRAGLKKVAVVMKFFKDKQELMEYAYKQQLHRRNLSEQDIFNAYKKLRELTNSDGKKAKTDVEIAEDLHVSPRQIAKMKEVEKKASPEVLEAFSNGELTLNKAYNQMKEELKPDEEKGEVQEEVQTAEDVKVLETESVQSDDEASNKKETPPLPVETPSQKPRKIPSEKPAVEKISLKFKPEDFTLIKTAAEKSNLSVTEYIMNLVMGSVQNIPTENVSEKETA